MTTPQRITTPQTRFHQHLEGLGIPIAGVKGTGNTAEIEFSDDATDEQKRRAFAERTTFDWKQRRPRSLNSVLQGVANLNENQRSVLVAAVVAEFLRERPDFARRLGIELDGDEVDPHESLLREPSEEQ